MPEQIQDEIIAFEDLKEYNISYPVIITRWEIKQVRGFNKQYLQVYFQKISDNVRAFHFNVKCYSVFGEVVDKIAEISIDKVVEKNIQFSEVVPLKVEARKVEIYLQKFCLLDNTVIEPIDRRIALNNFKPFNYEDSEVAKRLLPNAKGLPVDNDSHWYCACGLLHTAEMQRCENCHKCKQEIFSLFTPESIQEEKVKLEKEELERKNNVKKKKKLIASLISVAVAVCILIGTLIGTLTPFQDVTVKGMRFTKEGNEGYVFAGYKGKSATIEIPLTVRGLPVIKIDIKGNYENKTVTSLIVSDNISVIHNPAFHYFENLTNIVVSENNETYCSIDGVLFSKDKATIECFPRGREDNVYNIPNSVGRIVSYAFYHCDNLTSIIIPESVYSIERVAIYRCDSLTNLIIPANVYYIKGSAFADCKNLKYIYAEASGKPSGWDSDWNLSSSVWNSKANKYNYTFYNVVWGYKG